MVTGPSSSLVRRENISLTFSVLFLILSILDGFGILSDSPTRFESGGRRYHEGLKEEGTKAFDA